jgi:hypothetical protein
MLVTEANLRFYLPPKVMLTVKNHFDWRLKKGDFSVRYQPRIILDRDF